MMQDACINRCRTRMHVLGRQYYLKFELHVIEHFKILPWCTFRYFSCNPARVDKMPQPGFAEKGKI